MGQNYQEVKYALFVSLFVSFHGDLESKWVIGGLGKKFPIDKYTKDSIGMALFFMANGLNLTQLVVCGKANKKFKEFTHFSKNVNS